MVVVASEETVLEAVAVRVEVAGSVRAGVRGLRAVRVFLAAQGYQEEQEFREVLGSPVDQGCRVCQEARATRANPTDSHASTKDSVLVASSLLLLLVADVMEEVEVAVEDGADGVRYRKSRIACCGSSQCFRLQEIGAVRLGLRGR